MHGMFDKDKEIGLALIDAFDKGEEFVMYDATVDEDRVEIPDSKLPPARKTRLQVARLSDPAEQFEVTTLGSAIADKAEEAEPSDFPAVCLWTTVKTDYNDATVVRFIREFVRG